VKDLSAGTVDLKNGHEVLDGAYLGAFGDWVLYNPTFYDATIKKYTRLDNGLLMVSGSLTLSANAKAGIGDILVVSPTKAYATVILENKIVVFNPETMTKTSEINLADPKWGAEGSATPNPMGMIVRDGYLYVGCIQATSLPITKNGAYILLIDTETDTPVKMISDTRGSSASFTGGGLFIDEKSDIYVTCFASFGYIPGQKSGFLRIKKGETAFDKDYFFNITDMPVEGVEGGKISYSLYNCYDKDGVIYLFGNCPALTSNPPDYVNDKDVRALKANLETKKIEVLDLPLTNSYSGVIKKMDDLILFSLTTKSNGVGLFSYNTKTGETSKTPVLNTSGTIMNMVVFE
ncbi:MAG TPA: hypothetical protein DDZ78_01270, partial [Porphyromonadaceae bacterium]|nr:hypothetical protein [Porphyromonadaceae bacterium]